jgi:predicted dehydrogenase
VTSVPRVALVGTGGYGACHLANIERLQAAGLLRFAGCTDVALPDAQLGQRIARMDGEFFRDYRELLRRGQADVVVVSTPPHLHRDMSCSAFEHGANVLVEKPPAVRIADLDAMIAASSANGRLCQVGFQTLGSTAIARASDLTNDESLGIVEHVAAVGCWIRDDVYYSRAPWAGRRHVDGAAVSDGALTNTFAHAVMNCLKIAGITTRDAPRAEVELLRTRSIEVEDTACLRVITQARPTITIAVTLCSPEPGPAYIDVRGTRGSLRWWYLTDRIEIQKDGQPPLVQQCDRADLLENLLDVMAGRSTDLICPLENTRPFVVLAEWIASQDVQPISPQYVKRVEDEQGCRYEIPGVNDAIERAMSQQRLFSELQPPPAFLAR